MPSKCTLPESGVSSISSVRASVDFPQPDSPTRPSVSPRSRSSVMPSSADSLVLGVGHAERLAQIADLEQLSQTSVGCPSRAGGSTSSGKWQAALRRGADGVERRPLGGADLPGQRAARLVDAAFRDRMQVGRRAADRLQLVAAPRVDGHRIQQPLGVGMLAGWRKPRQPGRFRRCYRHTSPRPGRLPRRPAPSRG